MAVSINLALHRYGKLTWDRTVLLATRQWWESRLYPQPQQVLDLATPVGCKT